MRLAPDDPERTPNAGQGGAHTPALESPSLFTAGTDGPPAFELKFLLTEELARAVESHVAAGMALDPHADPALGNAYLTTSVYTDTPAFEVLNRLGSFGRRKYRVRRYGVAGPVFAERKTKTGDRVRKRRSAVPAAELHRLDDAEAPADWPASWFHRQLTARTLRPVCRVSYERVAYMGTSASGAVRVTFDRNVRGAAADGWAVDVVAPGSDLLGGRVVCEFKYRLALPAVFKAAVERFGLAPATVSKYRLYMGTVPRTSAGGAVDA